MASRLKFPKLRRGNIHRVNDLGETALFDAVKKGRLKSVQKLVKLGCDLNHRNFNGQTALHVAAIRGHLHIVDYLTGVGISLECQDIAGSSPLAAPINYVAGWMDIRSFPPDLAQKHKAVVLRLIEAGASLDTANLAGDTPLYVAIKYHGIMLSDFYVASLLVRHGCDVNSIKKMHEKKSRISALKMACQPFLKGLDTTKYHFSQECIELLLEAGVRPEQHLQKILNSAINNGKIPPHLKALTERIIQTSRNPFSLRQTCRVFLRQKLQPRLFRKIDRLPVSMDLKNYLKIHYDPLKLHKDPLT